MGNSGSQVIGQEYKDRYQGTGEYELHKNKEKSDVFNFDVILYQGKLSKNTVACIQKMDDQEAFNETQRLMLDKRMNIKNVNLIKLLGYFSSMDKESFCGKSFSRCYYVEYPVGTLQDEINLRKFMNKPFKELDLWGFLRSIVNGLLELQYNDTTCKNISSSTIYIDSQGFYQICDIGIVKDTAIVDEVVFKIITNDMYLSPGQVEIIRDKSLYDETDAFSSDIFSLGVVLTELAYLEDQGDIFRYTRDIGIDQDRLKERVSLLDTHYSKKLMNLVTRMIEPLESKRINLDQLYEELDRNYFRLLQDFLDKDLERSNQQAQTNFIQYVINRKHYEHNYKNKKATTLYESPDISSQMYFTSKIPQNTLIGKNGGDTNYEEDAHYGNNGDSGENVQIKIQNNKQSLSQLSEAYQNENKIVASLVNQQYPSRNDDFLTQNNYKKPIQSQGFQKLHQNMPKMQLHQYFMKLQRNKIEKEELINKLQALDIKQNKNQDVRNEIFQVIEQIKDNEQLEIILQNQMESDETSAQFQNYSPQRNVRLQRKEEVQDSPRSGQAKSVNISHNVRYNQSEQQQYGQIIVKPSLKQRPVVNYSSNEENQVYKDQNSINYQSSDLQIANDQQNILQQQVNHQFNQNFQEQQDNYEDDCYNQQDRPSIQPNEFSPNQLYQQTQYPDRHQQNLDRYEQRLSKYNYCTDRYQLANSFFYGNKNNSQDQKDQPNRVINSNQSKLFNNKVIKKQSISQIIIKNSIKRKLSDYTASPSNTSHQCNKQGNNLNKDNNLAIMNKLLLSQNILLNKNISLNTNRAHFMKDSQNGIY